MASYETASDMRRLFDDVSNWGRWGRDDELGTLNYLKPARVAAAARLVQVGRQISCARNFPVQPGPENPTPALHHMVIGGDDPCAAGVPGLECSLDFIGIAYHGLASTHIDALCHVFVDKQMYNGVPAGEVRSTGARRNSIMSARDGIVGRGILLDIPRLRNASFVDPSEPVRAYELTEAERAQNTNVGEADILLIALGRDACRQAKAASTTPPLPGLHPDCVPWLHQRKISVLGSDAVHDPVPSPAPIENWPIPVHMCALVSMGLPLLDNLYLADLQQLCGELKRWEFLFCASPLRIEKGTGSPLNPIAVF